MIDCEAALIVFWYVIRSIPISRERRTAYDEHLALCPNCKARAEQSKLDNARLKAAQTRAMAALKAAARRCQAFEVMCPPVVKGGTLN